MHMFLSVQLVAVESPGVAMLADGLLRQLLASHGLLACTSCLVAAVRYRAVLLCDYHYLVDALAAILEMLHELASGC